MSDSDNGSEQKGVNRRQFLSAGAIPLAAAAILPAAAVAQSATSGDGSRNARRDGVVRVGMIGAGRNLQRVQIPGFRKIAGCELVAVANSSLASSQRVADEFNIPKAYANWKELLEDDEIDAISIGTPPYMHRIVTLAALERGKHVLSQARMARNVEEARDMLDASRRYPDLVTQVVPMSQSYWQDNLLTKMIEDGYVGEILSVELQRLQTGRAELTGGQGFADFGGELSWRHQQELGGYNALNVGQTYEEAMRWLGRGRRVMAMSKIHVPFRRDSDGHMVSVDVPDHLDIMYELANGAQVHMKISATTGLSTGNQTWIYGTEGTIFADADRKIYAGKRGDSRLSEVPNPNSQQAHYRVEEEFVNAIRGTERVKMNTFEVGVAYMEFIEAVYRSSRSGQAVYLPL